MKTRKLGVAIHVFTRYPRGFRAILLPLLLGGLTTAAQAQDTTYTWLGDGTNPLWTTLANWMNSLAPFSSPNTALDFQGTRPLSNSGSTASFALNLLQFDVAASVFTLQGGPLNFVNNTSGTAPQLTFNAVSGIPSAAVHIQDNINLTNNLTLNGSGVGTLTLLGAVSGTGSLSQSGNFTTQLTDTNTYSGGTYFNGGTLAIVADGSLGTGNNLTFNNGTLQLGTVAGTGGTFALSSNRTFTLNSGNNTLDTNGYNTTIATAITGAGGLVKTGSGALTTSTSFNTYNGDTVINGGSIIAESSLPLGHGTVTLNVDNGLNTNNLSTIGLGGLAGSGALNLGTPSGVLFNLLDVGSDNASTTYSGVLSGVAALRKEGSGTLTLANTANTYSSYTEMFGGTLNAAALGSLGTNTNLIFSGGTLQWGSQFDLGSAYSLSILQFVGTTGGGTLDNNGYNVNIAGLISGDYGLTITGSGTTTLSNTGNSYLGGTTITNATLVIAADGSLGASAPGSALGEATVGLTFNNGTLQLGTVAGTGGTFALSSNRTFTLNSGNNTLDTNGYNTTIATAITGAGGLVKAGDGLLSLTNSGNTYSGGTFLEGGILAVFADGNLGATASNLNFDGGTLQWTGNFNLNGNRTIVLDGGGGTFDTGGYGTTISSLISGTGSLTKVGVGTLALSNLNNSYQGGTVIENGTVNIVGDTNLGAANATLALNGGNLQWGASFALNSDRNITIGGLNGSLDSNGFSAEVDGVISGPGSLIKLGAGPLLLEAANTFTGDTQIRNGSIVVGNSLALQDSTANLTIDNSLDANNLPMVTLGGLEGSGALNVGATLLTVGNNNATTTYSGIFSGTGGLTKVGTGTLTLSNAANSETGSITVNAGTLVLQNATYSNFGTVPSGATLQLYGTTSNLGDGSLQADSGGNIQYGGGAVINNGYLDGPCIHTILNSNSTLNSATFNSVTLDAGTQIVQNGVTTFNHIDNSANMVSNAELNWNHGALTSAGTLEISNGATDNLTGVYSNGVITVDNGGTLNYNGTHFVLGGGSQTYIGSKDTPGGLLEFNGSPTVVQGDTVELNGGLLVNNGTIDGLVNVNYGSLAKGTGNYAGGYNINTGGNFIYGNSPGTLLSGSSTWNAGGKVTFQIDDANGVAGTNWGLNQINGTLTLAAGKTPASLFTLAIQSLKADDTPGNAANFDPTHNYTWTFVTTTQGIQGFDPGEFSIDASGFSNPLDGGYFSVFQNGNNLDVNFVAVGSSVPEGSTLLSAGLMLTLGGMLLRRKRDNLAVAPPAHPR